MHDGMPYDPIQVKVKVVSPFSKSISPSPFTMGAAVANDPANS